MEQTNETEVEFELVSTGKYDPEEHQAVESLIREAEAGDEAADESLRELGSEP